MILKKLCFCILVDLKDDNDEEEVISDGREFQSAIVLGTNECKK